MHEGEGVLLAMHRLDAVVPALHHEVVEGSGAAGRGQHARPIAQLAGSLWEQASNK